MKKNFAVKAASMLLAALMVVGCIPATTEAAPIAIHAAKAGAVGECVTINTTLGQYIHEGTSTDSAKIGSLLRGDWRTIQDVAYVNGTAWYKVHVKANITSPTGWIEEMPSQIITSSIPTEDAETHTSYEIRVATPSGVNVRQSQSSIASIVGTLANGATAPVLSYNNMWVKVKYYRNKKYITGYVERQYVDLMEESTTAVASDTWSYLKNYNAIIKLSKNALKVHVSPSLSSEQLASPYASIPAGYEVKAIAKDAKKQWIEINYNGKIGYIYYPDAKLVKSSGKLKLSKTKTTLKKGKTRMLTVNGLKKNSTAVKITWKSNKSAVKVSKCGVVTAKKKGTAVVTAKFKYGTKTKTLKCTVIVK